MPALTTLHFNTDGLPDAQAFDEWRALMSPILRVERTAGAPLPRGNLSCTVVGDMLASRMVFNVQDMIRDPALANATPDHYTAILYLEGGLNGEIAGKPVVQRRNRLLLANMGRELATRGARSSAIGLTIPRKLLPNVGADTLPLTLDRDRARLLAAWLHAFDRRLLTAGTEDEQEMAARSVAFVHRLFDPSPARDVLEGAEMDGAIVQMAEHLIELALGSPTISPTQIAGRIGVSRATLYRAFAPSGGVMRRAWELRLAAVRTALDNPLETRNLGRLADDHGFKTLAHMSRAFRDRFGASPTEWRQARAHRDRPIFERTPELAHRWYAQLGRA